MNMVNEKNANTDTNTSICGVLIQARQQDIGSVREQLVTLTGVEVHATTEEGRMVVTVESDRTGEVGDTLMQLQQIPGVVSASLVYQFTDKFQNSAEEVSQ